MMEQQNAVLKVIYWNANGVIPHKQELRNYIKKNKIQIVLLCETHLTVNKKFNIPGYRTYRTDRPGGVAAGGTAILVRNDLPHSRNDSPALVNIEATSCTVNINKKKFKFTSVYKRPSEVLQGQDIKSIFQENISTLVAGDLNSKHIQWGCNSTNQSGRRLLHVINEESLTLVAPIEPTHVPRQADFRPDILDIAITKQFMLQFEQEVINNFYSDHLPVLIKLKINLPQMNEYTPKLNWGKLIETLQEINIDKPIDPTENTLEKAAVDFKTMVNTAMQKSTDNIKKKSYREELPETALEMIKIRNKLRKRFNRTRDPEIRRQVNELQRIIQKEIYDVKQEEWEVKTENLILKDNSLWRVTKSLKKENFNIPSLVTPNGMAETNEEKVEALAESLQKQFEPNNMGDLAFQNQIENEVITYLLTPWQENPTPISEQEMEDAMKQLKPNKAPGPDKITNKILKALPKKLKDFLLWLFNNCLEKAYYPKEWKRTEVRCLPKPGKDLKQTSSYRPISLLNTVGKLFDRIILKRINVFIDENDGIPNEQFGFRKSHDTVQQVLRLTEKIVTSFGRQEDTATVLLDVQKAFDSVWHPGLLFKLTNNIPKSYVHLIASFLQDRSFYCSVNGVSSTEKPIKAGVPQGALYSPTLYSVFTQDIPKMEGIQLGIYADDTSISVSGNDPAAMQIRLQLYLDELEEWCTNWKIQINAEKTNAILFSKKRNPIRPAVLYGDKQIEWKTTVKTLGVTMDQKLTWAPHINGAVKKAKAARAQLMPLLNQKSKLRLKNKLLLYKSVIRPAMLYGGEVWGAAAKTHLKKLQVIQNTTLRLITEAPYFVRNKIIHSDLKVDKVKHYIRDRAFKLYERSANSANPEVLALGQYDIENLRRCPKIITTDIYLQEWDF